MGKWEGSEMPPMSLRLHNPMPPLRKCVTSDSRAPAGLHVDAGWGPLARLKVGPKIKLWGCANQKPTLPGHTQRTLMVLSNGVT